MRKPIIFGPNSDFVFHIDEKQLEILNINFYENANANHQKGVRGMLMTLKLKPLFSIVLTSILIILYPKHISQARKFGFGSEGSKK